MALQERLLNLERFVVVEAAGHRIGLPLGNRIADGLLGFRWSNNDSRTQA